MLDALTLLSFGPGGWGLQLAAGTAMTLELALASLIVGVFLGGLGAAAKLAPSRSLNAAGECYTTVIRALPELLTLFIIYYGLQICVQWMSGLLGSNQRIELNTFTSGVLALSLVFGGYATEVFRGAVVAVPKGQIDAALAVGMSRSLMSRRVLVPLMWRFALPGIGNLWLSLLKDTSLVSVIALEELMRVTTMARVTTKEPFIFYGAACFIYLALTSVSMVVLTILERTTMRGVRRV